MRLSARQRHTGVPCVGRHAVAGQSAESRQLLPGTINKGDCARLGNGFRTLVTPSLADWRICGARKPPLLRLVTIDQTRAIEFAFLPTLDIRLYEALPFGYGRRTRAGRWVLVDGPAGEISGPGPK